MISEQLISVVLFTIVIGFPIVIYRWLQKYPESHLSDPVFVNKFGNLYQDVRLEEKQGISFFPCFIVRRLLFVMLSGTMYTPYIQLSLFLLMQTGYIIYYITLKPHVQRSRYRLEAFNEYMILLITTHFMPTSAAGSSSV